MKECKFCKEEIKDNAIKCWHCKTMLRRSPLRWLLLIALVVCALHAWLLSHEDHGHVMTLKDLPDFLHEQGHLASLIGVLGSVFVAGLFRSPLGD